MFMRQILADAISKFQKITPEEVGQQAAKHHGY